LTFTLSANAGYKVKTLTIGDATYSDVTDNTITKKVKIKKETAVSATLEEEASSTPETGIFTDTQGNKVTIAPLADYYGEVTGYRLTGDIYIEEINSEAFKAKLDTLNGKDLYTDSLNINCFKSNPAQTGTGTYISKEITPEILKGVLELKKARKFSTLKLNNKTSNGSIDIKFNSTVEKSFDIKDLNKFSFSNNFKLDSNSNVIVGSNETKQTDAANKDTTPYPKVNDLLTLLRNETLKDYIIVKDVYITGNVKDLLPLLVEGPNKIKEVSGGIKFLNPDEFLCPGPNVTEYNGWEGNTTPLTLEQLLEFRKRTNTTYNSVLEENVKSIRVLNLVLKNIDSTKISEEQLKFLHSKGDYFSGDILFEDSNLSKMQFGSVRAGTASITFKNTTLPQYMIRAKLKNLTLKDVIFPKEEFNKNTEYDFSDLPYNTPMITDNLTIYGEIKDSPLKDLTQEQIEKLKNDPRRPTEMPGRYRGSQEIYDRLKYIYRGESHTKEFVNLQGSIQKPQATSLALLGNSKAHD